MRALLPPSTVRVIVVVLGLLHSFGCDRKPKDTCAPFAPVWSNPATAGDPAVAWVDGVPILRSEVVFQMGSRNIDARKAVDLLIEREVVAQQARRVGLLQNPDVRSSIKKKAVYKLLEKVFEKESGPDDVPEKLIKKAYRLNIRRFVRPPLRKFSHVLVRLPWRRKGKRLIIYKEEIENGRKLAHELRMKALDRSRQKPLTWREFESLAESIRNRGFVIQAERGTKARKELRKPFADELFSMQKPGSISSVVKTSHGFHVILLIEKLAARSIPYKNARKEILERIYPEVRAKAFIEWVDRIKDRCPVVSFPERIPILGASSYEPETRRQKGLAHAL